MKRLDWMVCIGGSALLLLASWLKWLPLPRLETWGFVTGAVCVYLVVKENIWNFPIGIANNIFFIFLFVQQRLYADTGLQVVYFTLGVQGWYSWLHVGHLRETLPISRAPLSVLLYSTFGLAAGTYFLTNVLHMYKGSAPFLDALTTSLSLAAQFLLNFKYIENWYVWIIADILYVYLYAVKGLSLTAVLYAGFIGLCIAGLRQWNLSLQAQEIDAGKLEAAA